MSGKRTVGYIRGSTEEQELTLQGQIDQITNYIGFQRNMDGSHRHELAEDLGYYNSHSDEEEVIPGFYVDAGFSAGKVEGRTAYTRLLEDILLGNIDYLVVTKIDRLHRDVFNLLGFVKEVSDTVDLIFMDIQVDTSTPGGKLVLTMLAAVAEMERGLIADRTKAGLEVVKRQGRHVGRPPYGFTMDEENKGVLLPVEADIVVARDMIGWNDSGETITAIIDILYSRGIKSPTGKDRWNHPSVKKVIGNTVLYSN
jgi:DNA invertase Pin-like site-specific DNA recombinase